MAVEQYANNAQSNLNGAINNAVTSLVVNNATSFPAAGNFRIIIDQEIMLVTAVASNTFTVTRAAEGTAAAAHANNALVTQVVTEFSIRNAIGSNFGTASGSGTYTLTLSPALDAYTPGPYFVQFLTTNSSSPPTLNINGLGAVNIDSLAGTGLSVGQIVPNATYCLIYGSGTFFIMSAIPTIAVDNPSGFQMTYLTGTTFSVGPGVAADKTGVQTLVNSSTQTITVSTNGSALGADTAAITVSTSGAVITVASGAFTIYPATALGSNYTISGGTTATPGTVILGEIQVGDLFGSAALGYTLVSAVSATGVLTLLSALTNGSAAVNRIENPYVLISGTIYAIDKITSGTSLTANVSIGTLTNVTAQFGAVGTSAALPNTMQNLWIGSGTSGVTLFVSGQRTTPIGNALSGYTRLVRRIGSFIMASSNILPFRHTGLGCTRRYDLDTSGIKILNAGTGLTPTSFSAGGAIPQTANLLAVLMQNSGAIIAQCGPRGFTNFPFIFQSTAAQDSPPTLVPMDAAAGMQYQVSSGNVSIFVFAYEEDIYQ